jgi:hypothetical protein
VRLEADRQKNPDKYPPRQVTIAAEKIEVALRRLELRCCGTRLGCSPKTTQVYIAAERARVRIVGRYRIERIMIEKPLPHNAKIHPDRVPSPELLADMERFLAAPEIERWGR